MADKKISELVEAGALTGDELIAIVQSGVTKQVNLLAIKELAMASAPDAFLAEDWSIAAGDEEAYVTIAALPGDGGSEISGVAYRLDGGSWVASGGISSFTISGLTNHVTYDVELRALNSVGAGAASDVKAVTPAASWSPLDLGAKVKAWWDHADISTLWQDTAATTPVSADTDPVARVDDKSGNGKHKVQATSGNRPAYRTNTGKARLVYDGTNDTMVVTTPGFALPTLEYFAIISAVTSSDAADRGIATWMTGGNDYDSAGSIILALRGSVPHIFNYANNGQINLTVGIDSGQLAHVHRIELINATTTATIRSTGGASGDVSGTDSSFTALSSTHSGNFYEGARYNSGAAQAPLGFSMHEVIVAADLTSDERTSLRAYLDAKWRS